MKNFVFPQIFQPVLQKSNLANLNWTISSRRVQTQIQLLNSREQYHRYVKLSNKRLVLHPTQQKHEEGKYQKVGKRISSDLSLTMLKQGLGHGDPYQDEIVRIREKQKENLLQYEQKISERGQLIEFMAEKATQEIGSRRSEDEIKQRNREGYFTEQTMKKTEKTIKKFYQEGYEINEHKKQKQKFRQDIKIKKNTYQGIKHSNKNNLQGQRQKEGKAHINKGSFLKNIQSIEMDRNDFDKKETKNLYKKDLRKDRRRVGVQKKDNIDLEFEKSSEVNEVLLKNQIYNSFGTQNQYPSLLSTNKTKIYGTQHQMQKNNGRILRVQTFHAIVGSESEIRQHHHKRSYSIWDIVNSSQSEMEQPIKKEAQRIQLKKQKEQKQKILKKVHFGRTSIEQMGEQSKKEIKKSITILNSHKSIRHKGVPKRSEEKEGMDQIQSQKQIKITRNLVTKSSQLVKSARMKNNCSQNVYNDLNYLRMKLNFLKSEEEKPEDRKDHPKPLISHIQKVLYTKQLERQSNNNKINQMIDFAIFLGKDRIIKQVELNEKGNFFKK